MYVVTFTQYSVYEIEDAADEDDAFNKAYVKFKRDACYPVADTHYDEVDIEEVDEDE